LKITTAVFKIVREFEAFGGEGGEFRWLQSLLGQMGSRFHQASEVDSSRQPSRVSLVTPNPLKLKSLHVPLLTYLSLVCLGNANKTEPLFHFPPSNFGMLLLRTQQSSVYTPGLDF
jgi:hypothetical protein